MQRQAIAEAILKSMSNGLEPLLAAKETKNKPTKYRGTRDGNADGWMMLMKWHLEMSHVKATLLDKARTTIEFLENGARTERSGNTRENRSSVAKSNSCAKPLFRFSIWGKEARDQLASV